MKEKTFVVKHDSIMDCKTSRVKGVHSGAICSDKYIEQLTGIKAMIDKEEDTVNGSLTIDHGYGLYTETGEYIRPNELLRPHTFTLRLYEKDENANMYHNSKIKALQVMPTIPKVKSILNMRIPP